MSRRAFRLLLLVITGTALIAAAAAAVYRASRTTADPQLPPPQSQQAIFDRIEQKGNRMPENEPLLRLNFDIAELFAKHPLRLFNRNKEVVYAKACPPGTVHTGAVEFTRWHEMKLPEQIPVAKLQLDARADVYGYEAPAAGTTEWYVNFADEHLFFGYRGGLLAQDELQAAEHPVLGALREALIAKGVEFNTIHDGRPTPVLVMGAQRRCALALNPDASQGRPKGLYGNRFNEASVASVEKAIHVIAPPTTTNIIAIAAPSLGSGAYTKEELELILAAAYTGFRAAKLESKGPTAVHTGFWGCGAFGGNRELMALLQFLAARLAGIDRVVFHTFDENGLSIFERARAVENELSQRSVLSTEVLLSELERRGYKWGISDGN